MLAKVLTGAVVGLDGALVEVEVDIAPGGMPNFLVVGLPDAAVARGARAGALGDPYQRLSSPGASYVAYWIGP